MSRGLKAAVAILLVGGLGFPAYSGYELWMTDSKVDQARQELKSARNSSQGWADTQDAAQKEFDATTERARRLDSAAKAREGFDSSLEAAKEQLQLASGKISIEEAQQRIIGAQNRVLEEDADSKTIEDQTRELDAVASNLKNGLAELESQRASRAASAPAPEPFRIPSAKAPASSSQAAPVPVAPVDWLADMRARLDAVGGASVPLQAFDGNCDGVTSIACSRWEGRIDVAPSIASWSPARKNTVMAHELAHQYQFRVMDQIEASPGYRSLFGGSIELLANCMASAKGYTAHGGSCNQAQLDWARSIWSGAVPG